MTDKEYQDLFVKTYLAENAKLEKRLAKEKENPVNKIQNDLRKIHGSGDLRQRKDNQTAGAWKKTIGLK